MGNSYRLQLVATVELDVDVSVIDGDVSIDRVMATGIDGEPVLLKPAYVWLTEAKSYVTAALKEQYDVDGIFEE